MSSRIENINERGARWRRRNGVVCLVIAALLCALLFAMGAPPWSRVVLAIPIGVAAGSFLQAREKTCVALCALGQREPTDDRPERTPTPAEQRALVRQSAWIIAGSIVIATAAAALFVLI